MALLYCNIFSLTDSGPGVIIRQWGNDPTKTFIFHRQIQVGDRSITIRVARHFYVPGTVIRSPPPSNIMLVVYDLADRSTFTPLESILKSLPYNRVLVASSTGDRQISYAEGAALAKTYNIPFYELPTDPDTILKDAILQYYPPPATSSCALL